MISCLQGLSSKEMGLLKERFRAENSCIDAKQCPVHADRVKSSAPSAAVVASNSVALHCLEYLLKQKDGAAASSAGPSKKLFKAGLSDRLS